MKIDRVFLSLGIADISETVPAEAVEILCEFAEQFYRAGGVLRIDDWCEMNEVTRAAFVQANEFVQKERIAMIGVAAQSPLGPLAVTDPQAALDKRAAMANDTFVQKMASKVTV